jgi:hypothetical protein
MFTALHEIVAGFVRRTWLVTLVAVIVCAGFAARAVAAFSAVDATVPAAKAARVVAAPKPRKQPDGTILVERNIFCSTCVPDLGSGPSSAYAGQPAVLIAINAGKTPVVTVRVIPTEVQGSWALGETIPGVGRVDHIGNSMIEVVDAAGHRGRLFLVEPRAAGPAGAATPGGPAAADPLSQRVRKLSEGSYEVDRDLVRELVGGVSTASGVRIQPVRDKSGNMVLRVASARPTSVAGLIGLKPGDLLSAIDGEPVKDANQLLGLYSKLDQLSGLELQGTRAGKPLVIALKFR